MGCSPLLRTPQICLIRERGDNLRNADYGVWLNSSWYLEVARLGAKTRIVLSSLLRSRCGVMVLRYDIPGKDAALISPYSILCVMQSITQPSPTPRLQKIPHQDPR
jgi:hypothetical protein